jgi:hypothetical protein
MSGHIQRLLDRGAAAPGGEAATTELAALHAESAAPLLSPLAEADQRLQIGGFDADLLAAMLLEDTAREAEAWTIPHMPFGSPQQRQDETAGDARPSPTPAPEVLFRRENGIDFPAAPRTNARFNETRDTAAPRQAYRQGTPERQAETLAQPRTDDVSSISERIVERRETVTREPGETRYLYLRDSAPETKATPDPRPREVIVERQETVETIREIGMPGATFLSGETPPETGHTARRETRAEPALSPRELDLVVMEAPVEQSAPLDTPSPQQPEQQQAPEIRRGGNEADTAPEPLAPWTSAAAASVIGSLPLRPTSLTIRGWRRR